MLDFVKFLLRVIGSGMGILGGFIAPTASGVAVALQLVPILTNWFTTNYNSALGGFASRIRFTWHQTFTQASSYFSEWFGFFCHMLALDQLVVTVASAIRILGTLVVIAFAVFLGVAAFAVVLGINRHCTRAVKVLTASLIDAE